MTTATTAEVEEALQFADKPERFKPSLANVESLEVIALRTLAAEVRRLRAAHQDIVPAQAWSLQTLREMNERRQFEWSGGEPSKFGLSYKGNELAGEVGEACNVLKKLERERLGLPGSRATKEQLAEELADVVICADLAALEAGVDLYAAVPRKFNATSEKVGLSTRMPTP